MPWIAEDRRKSAQETGGPYLTDTMKQHLEQVYFPRYPTRRAALLAGLHLVQHEYNWVPMRAIEELAEFLGIAPAEALDTASFYEEYWLKPKGKYLIQVCRSLSCEICGSKSITGQLVRKLGIEVGETTPDGRFTLVELECLGACGGAPAMLINEVLYENVTPQMLDEVLAKLPEDPKDFRDPSITWAKAH